MGAVWVYYILKWTAKLKVSHDCVRFDGLALGFV